MTDLGTVLLGTIAAAGVGLVGHDDLVNQRLIEVGAENGVNHRDGASLLTLIVQDIQFHVRTILSQALPLASAASARTGFRRRLTDGVMTR